MKKDNINEENEIRVLDPIEAIRTRPGMYIGGVTNADILIKEIWDNASDESISCSYCNKIIIDQNWNGYNLVMDNGRGIPITMSKDKPGQTACDTAVSYTHAGSKFGDTDIARSGQNGVGSTAVNATSEEFILMSKITEENYDKSIPIVKNLWDKMGPRSKKDLFYIVAYRKGIKFYEGADKLDNIEKMIFSPHGKTYDPLPRGFSTIVMFKPDPEIFESTIANIPIKNIQYFLLIQEKLYKKKVEVVVNKELINGSFKPYKFEMFKTIIPADTSKNKSVSVYVTFEVDPELGAKQESGSVSGLSVEQGVHINYIESCYEQALINEYKIKHKFLQNGLKICVIVIAGDVVFSSQTKERLKSISKVKLTDFTEVVKEFQKIFRNNPEYWEEHVAKLNYLAESMKSLSAAEKAQKMIEESQGREMFRSKAELIPGFADATELKDRWSCELFLTEGLSPASSLKSGRLNPLHHAVLPLRGKILNVNGKSVDQALDNKEIFTIFKVIGLGMDINNVTSKAKSPEEAYELIKKYSRYGKIVIATD